MSLCVEYLLVLWLDEIKITISCAESKESRQELCYQTELRLLQRGAGSSVVHLFRMGVELMDGPRLVISQRALGQDAGGGLWGP